MKTKIKMHTPFHGNYVVSVTAGEEEYRERCQKLFIRELNDSQKEKYYKDLDEKDIPTHQVSFHDFGCRRVIEGKLNENEEDKVSFEVHGKIYRFSPFVPKR